MNQLIKIILSFGKIIHCKEPNLLKGRLIYFILFSFLLFPGTCFLNNHTDSYNILYSCQNPGRSSTYTCVSLALCKIRHLCSQISSDDLFTYHSNSIWYITFEPEPKCYDWVSDTESKSKTSGYCMYGVVSTETSSYMYKCTFFLEYHQTYV